MKQKLAFDQRTLDILKGYMKPVGIGAGIGAAGMGLSEMMSPEEEGRDGGDIMKSMLLGGALGGLGGAAYQTGANLTRPHQASPAGMKANGLPEKLQDPSANNAWLNATRPEASIPLSAGAGYGSQWAANKLLAGPDLKDVKMPNMTYSGLPSDDPYLNRVIKPKAEIDARSAGAKTNEQLAAGKEVVKSHVETFNNEANAVNQLRGKGGKLSREGWEKLMHHSSGAKPELEFKPGSEDTLRRWNPAMSNMPPGHEQLYKMKRTLGDGPTGLANQMTALQKMRAAIQNPLAELVGQGAEVGDKLTGNKFKLTDKVYSGRSDLDPRYIDRSAMKAQLPWQDALDPHARTGKPNRFGYTPKSQVLESVMTGKGPGLTYGRKRYAIGPAVGLGSYLGLDHLHDNALSAGAAEAAQRGGPGTEELMRQLASDMEARKLGLPPQKAQAPTAPPPVTR